MFEPGQPDLLSPEEARAEAKFISDLVGTKGEKNDYDVSHGLLVEQQAKERLAGRDWTGITGYAISRLDSYETARRKGSSIRYQTETKAKERDYSTQKLHRLEADSELITNAIKEIGDGSTQLKLELYGDNLYLGLMNSCDDQNEFRIKSAIFDKLRAGKERQKEGQEENTINLEPEEVEFLKNKLPSVAKSARASIDQYRDSLTNTERALSLLAHEDQIVTEQVNELQTDYLTAISILDQAELQEGAPPYANPDASTGEKHQAYVDRIAWRRNKLRQDRGYDKLPYGREISRKWAFLHEVDGHMKVINQGTTWHDVTALELVIDRVPEEVIAIYSEGTYLSNSKNVSVAARINNGQISFLGTEDAERISDSLAPQYSEIVEQL